jgi:hypothetical protein
MQENATVEMTDEIEDNLNSEEAAMQLEEKIQVFGTGLQTKFDKQVGLKEQIERRWLDDLRHYNGVYDAETEKDIKGDGKTKKSRIFVNLTRAKANTAESKWSDLVLPTDDRNWGIKPTPVPSLAKALTDETELILSDGTIPTDSVTGEPLKKKDLAAETLKQAVEAALLMENEIDDQLTEAKFNATCREIIHNAVTLGTGIIKGPMVEVRTNRAWVMDENGEWGMNTEKEFKPTASDVDPWNFFPDMSATKWSEAEFCFERHMMIQRDLRKLADQPGFLKNQVAKVLMNPPNANAAKINYLNELREINGINQAIHDNRYEVLEYHGPIDKSDLIASGAKGLDVDDPLEEYEGVVWVCMGIVIKVGLNHLDSNELPYNVVNWEKDETSIFGFGVPYRMRDPQKVMNASWRMVLDNAGLSTGPQIVVNKEMVQPANDAWTLSPRKVWWITSKDPKVRAQDVFSTFEINSNQQELTNIFEMAHRLADEETSVPQANMASQSPDTQQPAMLKTLGGTALWMASNNIMMRRAVKHFDDDLTVPFLTKIYDWNMQFNKKNEIKGDYSIDARGTSVLLVREMQARNIQEFINAAMGMPGGPEELKVRGVLKNMAKGMQVSVDDVMRTDADATAAEKEARENPPIDPEAQKMQMTKELEEMKIAWQREQAQIQATEKMTLMEGERQIALIHREVELTKAAANSQVSMEKIRSDHGISKYKTDWSIKAFYTELAEKRREGEKANYGLEAK